MTFLMELNKEPENELELVRFSMPASEHERLVNAFLQEQFGGYDPADSGQQRTRQVLEAMVVSRSEDGMCTAGAPAVPRVLQASQRRAAGVTRKRRSKGRTLTGSVLLVAVSP